MPASLSEDDKIVKTYGVQDPSNFCKKENAAKSDHERPENQVFAPVEDHRNSQPSKTLDPLNERH